MGFINSYQYEEYGKVFDVADGDHTVIIMGAQIKTSQKGSQMLEISLLVPDAGNMIYIERYVEGDYFNQNMSKFFDAFGIKPGNFNFASWIRESTKGHFIHKEETYQDKQGMQKTVNRCKMQYLIVPEKEQFPEDIPYSQNTQQLTQSAQQGMDRAFDGNWQQPQAMGTTQQQAGVYQQPQQNVLPTF